MKLILTRGLKKDLLWLVRLWTVVVVFPVFCTSLGSLPTYVIVPIKMQLQM